MYPNLQFERKNVRISRRSRWMILMLRLLLKPMMKWFMRGKPARIAKGQLRIASRPCHNTVGFTQDYRIINNSPGHVIGDIDAGSGRTVLWIHGGAFAIPATPEVYLRMLSLLCRDLDATAGFLPDYRLAPFSGIFAALDDVERAYRGLLDLGYKPENIVIGGESAGGHLTLGLLQRIKTADLPMPACAVTVSPVTELGRAHAPPSRGRNARRDAMIPIASFSGMSDMVGADLDTADPHISPLYADYEGFPPLMFQVGETEVLLDDSVLAARQAEAAGVPTQLDVWPVLPHAFFLFEKLFPETRIAREDIVTFMRSHLEN